MDVLRRYSSDRTYTNAAGDSIAGRHKPIAKDAYTYTVIELDKPSTLDRLSLQFYGTPVMYWLIAEMNDMQDPLMDLDTGIKLKIPVIG